MKLDWDAVLSTRADAAGRPDEAPKLAYTDEEVLSLARQDRPEYFARVPYLVLCDPTLSPNAKLLYGYLQWELQRKGATGTVRHSQMVADFCCSDSALTGWLRELRRAGLLMGRERWHLVACEDHYDEELLRTQRAERLRRIKAMRDRRRR